MTRALSALAGALASMPNYRPAAPLSLQLKASCLRASVAEDA